MKNTLGDNVEIPSKQAVNAAKQRGAQVLTMIDGYQTKEEAELLMEFLWYARKKGVEVTFVSKEEKELGKNIKSTRIVVD